MATGCCQLQQQHGEEDNDDDKSFDMAALDQFDYIRFTLTDLNGIGRCLSVPRRHVEHCLHEGLGFYAGTTIHQPKPKHWTTHPMFCKPSVKMQQSLSQ